MEEQFEEIQKIHKGYENDNEIIASKEEFKKHIGAKFKVAWINKNGKLCLKSYIFVGQDNTNKDNFVAVDVVKGKRQPKNDDSIKPYDSIFNIETLVFVGFIGDKDKSKEENQKYMVELLNSKQQGLL